MIVLKSFFNGEIRKSSLEIVVSSNPSYFEGPEDKSLTSREHPTENDVSDYSRIFSYKFKLVNPNC